MTALAWETLADWLAWLGASDCTCEHRWRGLGVLYGVSFGNGWVRVTDNPGCPHHDRDLLRQAAALRDVQGGQS